MSLGKKTLREIRSFVDHAGDGDIDSVIRDAPRLLAALDAELKPKRSVKLARVRRVAKTKQVREDWADIRVAVLKRAGGRCESCGFWTDDLECDHMFSGSGRRVSLQSVFTVWAIDRSCHVQKTKNRPSPEYWLGRFIEHCEKQCLFGREGASCDGYAHAAGIAQKRLDSLRTQSELEHPRSGT